MKFKFNFKKKLPLLIGSSVLATSAPLLAVSCLYENNTTVLYAKKFINNNGLIVKQKVADPKKPALVNFENALFNSNLLTYTFSGFDYSIKSKIDINNEHLNHHVKNLFVFENHLFSKNQTALDSITISEQRQKIEPLLDKLITLGNELIQEQKSQNLIVFNTAEKIVSWSENTSDKKPSLPEKYKELSSLISQVKNFSYYDLSDLTSYVTKQDVENVVNNFLKDTPFYSKYLQSLSSTDNNDKVVADAIAEHAYVFNFRVLLKIGDYIPSKDFQSFQNELLGSNVEFNFDKVENSAKESIVKLFNFIKRTFPTYRVSPTASPRRGIATGFAPEYVIKGVNPNTNTLSDDYRVFEVNKVNSDKQTALSDNPDTVTSVLTSEQASSFINSPKLFLELHPDLIYLPSITTNLNRISAAERNIKLNQESGNDARVEKLRKDIVKYRKDNDDLNNQRSILKSMLISANEKYAKVQELTNKLNDPEQASKKAEYEADIQSLNQEIKDQLQLVQNKLNEPEFSTYKADYQKAFEILNEQIEETTTNIESLNELYAKTLFANGLYKIQLIKGRYAYSNNNKIDTVWLEFYDAKSDKWYMLDIYKAYLSYQPSSVDASYNIENNFMETLPAGYES
ncbi:hypothetical protein [Mycoplasma nasistruthionis]|uniref:Lipoprotein n=1 Tax=Mycoplasma nasistruthionis TaxID=353852 RepID=A0A4Y6I7A1_9MOLU|nr:hypothetical protein [Mycoplasma nasistruthionis]QDF64778.1 hypothetical protein FIV53_00365 [Mycoplasma nasistruthionis]